MLNNGAVLNSPMFLFLEHAFVQNHEVLGESHVLNAQTELPPVVQNVALTYR